MLESGLHLLPLGGVKHQRNLDVCHQPRGEFVHVGFTVTTDEIDVHVEYVRAFAFLLLAECDQTIPIGRVQEVAHLLRPAGVDALTDNQKRSILNVRLLKIDRRCGRRRLRASLLRSDSLHRFNSKTQVLRRRAATAADDIDAEVAREVDQLRGETLWGLVVVHLAFHNRRQTRIWKDRDWERRILADVTDSLLHVLWPGAAVHTDDVDRKRRESSECSGDLSAVEHGPKYFDRDLGNDRHSRSLFFKDAKDCGERSLRLQYVLTRFDNQ